VTQEPITPDLSEPNWRIGFSIPAGGVVTLAALEQLRAEAKPRLARPDSAVPRTHSPNGAATTPTPSSETGAAGAAARQVAQPIALHLAITGIELALLQQLAAAALPQLDQLSDSDPPSTAVWLAIERLLRQYAQFHFDRPVRSATLIDACFLPNLTTL
jgi:DNA repair protein RecO (recombination protein O)